MKTKKKNAKKILTILLSILLCASFAATTYAFVLFSFRVDGEISGGAGDLNGENLLDFSLQESDLSFNVVGERKTVSLTVENSSAANVVYDFDVTAVAEDSSLGESDFKSLTAAILTYFDGEFIGSLAEINGKNFGEGFVMAKNDSARQIAHSFDFELHIAADEEFLNKKINVKIATNFRNADYVRTVFVSSEAELLHIADDLAEEKSDEFLAGKTTGKTTGNTIGNGNTAETTRKTTIVLANDVTLTQNITISKAADVNLCGYNLLDGNGKLIFVGENESKIYSSRPITVVKENLAKIEVNNAAGYINIVDFYDAGKTVNAGRLYSENVALTVYDKENATKLVAAQAEKKLKYGIKAATEADITGGLSCYSSLITPVEASLVYDNGKITAPPKAITETASVTAGEGESAKTISFRIIGSGDDEIFSSVLSEDLAHLPDNPAGEALTCDVFLPKRIDSKNATIEWSSSDENSVSSDGKLADTLKENTLITLYARITINDKVYTASFSFRVTSQTRETKFKYLVAQLSPIKLTDVDKTGTIDEYHCKLPAADNSAQDYRKNYTMIDTTQWKAFKDIGLKSLTYKVNSGYNFVSLTADGKDVYLNSATFYTFAQLTVTGDFGDDEPCEANVNVIISLGDNSELFELAFSYVEKQFASVDILQNIIDTRSAYGMKYERGDFYIDGKYQTIELSYTSKSEALAISSDEIVTDESGNKKYLVRVDPSKFESIESNLAIEVTAKAEGGGQSPKRILYVSSPAVITPDKNGFANYSVFNSVKYQTAMAVKDIDVFTEETEKRLEKLPPITVSETDKGKTGFDENADGSVTNNTADYILARDAALVPSLEFKVGASGENVSDSHKIAYELAKLLKWATGSVKDEVAPIDGVTTVSDGKKYMNEAEVKVLKDYLAATGLFAEQTEIDELWKSATTTPVDGNNNDKGLHIIGDYGAVAKAAVTAAGGDGQAYFKYTEVLQWALNEKDFPNSHFNDSVTTKTAPNLGQIGNVNIGMGKNYSANSTELDWSSSPSDWTVENGSGSSGKYALLDSSNKSVYGYDEDDTAYITDFEAQCIMAFWYGYSSLNDTRGEAFAEVFLKSCIIPTYLNEDGAGILINEIYKKSREGASASGFTIALSGGVPEVSVMDYSIVGITYFTGVTSLKVHGEVANEKVVLPAFITDGACGNFFNRVTQIDAERTDVKLKEFAMKACATGHNVLSLENVARLTKVTSLDFSYNEGIKTIGDLLNLDISAITYLNVHGVGVSGKYLTYVLDNIKLNSKAEIYYTLNDASAQYEAQTDSVSEELRFLKEFTEINAPYLMVANKVNSGNGEKSVQWYVKEGNPAFLINDSGNDEYTTVRTAEAMNKLLANYYYCVADVNYGSVRLKAGNVYKIGYANGGISFTLEQENAEYEVVDEIPSASADTSWDLATITYEQNDNDKTISTSSNDAPAFTDTFSVDDSGVETVQTALREKFSDATVEKLSAPRYNNRITFSGGSYYVDVDGVYKATIPFVFSTTKYRRYLTEVGELENLYFCNDKLSKVKRFYRRDSRYVEYEVEETRFYTVYYVIKSGESVLRPILSGTIQGKNRNDRNTDITLTGYTRFTYNNSSYTYRNSNGAIYTSQITSAKCGSETFTGSTAASQVKAYIDGLGIDDYVEDDSVAAYETIEEIQYKYVTQVNSASVLKASVENAERVYNDFTLYKFVLGGTTASSSDELYINGVAYEKNYTSGGGYLLNFGADGYSFSDYAIKENSNAVNMEAILKEANSHLFDAEFGNYYGNYYCYNGTTRSVNGRRYVNGYVYRLLTNENGFYFEHDGLPEARKTFTTVTSDDSLKSIIIDSVNNGQSQKGRIIYTNIRNTRGYSDLWYGNGFFELTYNVETQIYYFKSMGGVGNVTYTYSETNHQYNVIDVVKGQNLSANATEISKFINIRYVASKDAKGYSGTGGSEEVEIVARITDDDGTVHERYYKVTVRV